jgi:hypothetical protein
MALLAAVASRKNPDLYRTGALQNAGQSQLHVEHACSRMLHARAENAP